MSRLDGIDTVQIVFAVHLAVGGLLLAFGLFRILSLGQTIPGAINAAIGVAVVYVGWSLVRTL